MVFYNELRTGITVANGFQQYEAVAICFTLLNFHPPGLCHEGRRSLQFLWLPTHHGRHAWHLPVIEGRDQPAAR